MQHVAPPTFSAPRNIRQLVDEARGYQQPASADRTTIVESHDKTILDALDRSDSSFYHLGAVAPDLRPALFEKLGRADTVPAQKSMHGGGRSVARLARVDDQHRAPGSPKHQRAA